MKKQILSIMISTIFISSAFAAGNHHGGHGDQGGHGNEQAQGAHKSTVGAPAATAEATMRIKVNLTDAMKMEFSEALTEIKSGTVIQFVIKNSGKIPHEVSIDSLEGQAAHAEMMRMMPNMVHAEGNTVTVAPGKLKFLTWRFEGNGEVMLACNIPGHFNAGMFKKVAITN